MWDVLSGDFDFRQTAAQCLENVCANAQAGSIIVFHDSIKTNDKLRVLLPQVLEYFARKDFRFAALPMQRQAKLATAG